MQATTYANNAEMLGAKEAFIIKAEVEWASGNQEFAIMVLKRGIAVNFPDEREYLNSNSQAKREDRMICAKVIIKIN
jgi:hypothetical protein